MNRLCVSISSKLETSMAGEVRQIPDSQFVSKIAHFYETEHFSELHLQMDEIWRQIHTFRKKMATF